MPEDNTQPKPSPQPTAQQEGQGSTPNQPPVEQPERTYRLSDITQVKADIRGSYEKKSSPEQDTE
jgi:hypothetical protein